MKWLNNEVAQSWDFWNVDMQNPKKAAAAKPKAVAASTSLEDKLRAGFLSVVKTPVPLQDWGEPAAEKISTVLPSAENGKVGLSSSEDDGEDEEEMDGVLLHKFIAEEPGEMVAKPEAAAAAKRQRGDRAALPPGSRSIPWGIWHIVPVVLLVPHDCGNLVAGTCSREHVCRELVAGQ